jgi:hypothetical protein
MGPVMTFLSKPPAQVLQVGDGKSFSRIEQALGAAANGAEIDVYPSKRGYLKTALLVKKRVFLRAMGKILLDGAGFAFTGEGSTPRAIIQVELSGSSTRIEGFEMTGASNSSCNAAAIRINQANDVTVKHCDIHGNDMGAMSNGEGPNSGDNQRFVDCRIHQNGTERQAGYNHNLYLGGASVSIDRCIIWGALTGHNLKSRAHFTSVTNSVLYGGANRQIDCVESDETDSPNSNLLVYNCILAMDPNSKGNGNVIHFGSEGRARKGAAYILQSTVFTQFLSPVLFLDSNGGAGELENDVVIDPDPMRPELAGFSAGVFPSRVHGSGDLFSPGYSVGNSSLTRQDFRLGTIEQSNPEVPLIGGTQYRLSAPSTFRPVKCWYRTGNGKMRTIEGGPVRFGADPTLFKLLTEPS